MNKMDVLIIGDSLAAQRPDGIEFEHRWPQLLEKKNEDKFKIVNISKGSSTSNRLRKVDFKTHKATDIAIVQLGIVDCVPRLFTHTENRILARIPGFLRQKVMNVLLKKRTRSESRRYVSIENYEKNFNFFVENFPGKIIIVQILEQGEVFKKANPVAGDSINSYNAILKKLGQKHNTLNFVSIPTAQVDSMTHPDGYHLNSDGHLYLSNVIHEILNKISNESI